MSQYGDLRVELFSFLKGYLAAPKEVGAFAPSSIHLAEVLTDAAHVSSADTIVEYGPGTGVFTEVIARKCRPETTVLSIELCENFVRAVRLRCPSVNVIHGSAVDTPKYLEQHGFSSCDCIVSGLPFANFEDELQDSLLDVSLKVLRPGGVFVTFGYFFSPYLPKGMRLKRKLEQKFKNLDRLPIVWRNAPPAFAYRAVKHG